MQSNKTLKQMRLICKSVTLCTIVPFTEQAKSKNSPHVSLNLVFGPTRPKKM